MKYLLDTCTLSDFAKGHEASLHRMKQESAHCYAISSISVMEVEYGLQLIKGEKAQTLGRFFDGLFRSIHVIEFDHPAAKAAATLRATLKSKGKPIGAYDVLIAATALTKGLTVVTSNTSEFARVPGLSVENWRES